MPVLMGKLDTSVNGPEGLPPFDGDAWDCVDWRYQEEQVRLCVPKISSTSCDQVILVNQATDLSVLSDAVPVEVDGVG
jgi:hypothetical protein